MAQIIQQEAQAAVQAIQVMVQETLQACQHAAAPLVVPMQPASVAPLVIPVPVQPRVQVAPSVMPIQPQPTFVAEREDELAHLAPEVSHDLDIKYLSTFST